MNADPTAVLAAIALFSLLGTGLSALAVLDLIRR